jgi:CheY-like chemotaxis protein
MIEDSDNDAELIVQALRLAGFNERVTRARDGAEGRDFLRREGRFNARAEAQVAVVLLDLKLPKINGLELLKMIREDARWKAVPVIALTSSRERRDLQDAYDLGVNAFVVKPIDFQELMSCVQQLGKFWLQINEPPPLEAVES